MRILIVQMQAASAGRVQPRFNQWLGVLAAGLRQDGHELELVAQSRYQSPELHEAICRFRPQAIYIDADRFAADITRHAVEFVGRHHVLPVIIGGMYPTAQPDQALSIPGVLAAAIGEPEVSVRRFLCALEHGEDYEQTAGVWTNRPDGPPVKNEPAPLTLALDALPRAERELFRYDDHVARTHAAEVSVLRGCPLRCAHCLSDWLAEMYLGRGTWFRRRGPANVCDEIDALCEQYSAIERIQFIDHAFALDGPAKGGLAGRDSSPGDSEESWLARFAAVYAERCGLPFSCHLRAHSVNARTVRLLQQAGCDHAVVEVVSGSDFIRNEVFEMATGNRQIERAFRLLAAAGIRTTVTNLVGSPYETLVTADHTLELIERIEPGLVQTRLFAPLPGTRTEELARECGWLAGLGEKAFRENVPMLRMPAMPPRAVAEIFEQFNWQARHPRWTRLMRRLARIPVGRRRTLYDVLVRSPTPNGRLLPADPRSIEVRETDGVMSP